MTPLARMFFKELTLPLKRRRIRDLGGLLKVMDDIHCFECSEVVDAAGALIDGSTVGQMHGMVREMGFLPAPKTWIEFQCDTGLILGVLLIEGADRRDCKVRLAGIKPGGVAASFRGSMRIPLHNADSVEEIETDADADLPYGLHELAALSKLLYALLAFINTPRVIGRQQHMPHRGLERDLVRAMKPVGKFPLHAWTEIKLDVTAPKDMAGDPSIEAHYTGQRALHFCRAHLRIRLGQLEIVRSHWRGDASLGIKQSRYRLVA